MKLLIPALEDVVFDQYYAFTYNPIDKYQYFASPACYRLKYCNNDIEDIFKSKAVRIKYYLEVSKKGRIHIHGVIKILDASFYIRDIRDINTRGNICIKDLKSEPEWETYCLKQQLPLDQYLQMNRIKSPLFLNNPDNPGLKYGE